MGVVLQKIHYYKMDSGQTSGENSGIHSGVRSEIRGSKFWAEKSLRTVLETSCWTNSTKGGRNC